MVNLNRKKCIPLKYVFKKGLIFPLFSPSTLFLCYIFSDGNFLHHLRPLIMVISKAATKHIWDFISSPAFLLTNMRVPCSSLFSNHVGSSEATSCGRAAIKALCSTCGACG